jgi:hypothetical protein
MLITQSGNFQKFKFETLAGISSNTLQMKIEQIRATVKITVLVRSPPVAMLLDTSAVDPSAPCPDPSRTTWEETRTAPGPPSLLLLPLCMLPTAVPSPAPTHSTPRPRQPPPSTRARPSRPVSPVHVASKLCAGHPLDAPVPAALAYKNPPAIKREDSPRPQLPPRHTHFTPLALARRRKPHR